MNNRMVYSCFMVGCLGASLSFADPGVEPETGEDSVNNSDIEEVFVLGARRDSDYTIITENTEKLLETAGALGDPLGAIFALPGVAYSDSRDPAVRGSSPNDNVFVVDFMPASYIFHDFGVSVFSEHILHDFQMYSAGFGPEYSSVTGAVFDVKLRDPKNEPLSGVVDFSMLRSGIFLESGLTENSAFYLSLRRSMLDLFIQEDEDEEEGIRIKQMPRDTDYQFKYLWNVTDTHRISLSANGASDSAEAELLENFDFVRSNPDFAGDAKLEGKYDGSGILWEYFGEEGTEWKLGFNHLHDEDNTYWGDSYTVESHGDRDTLKAMISVPVGSDFRFRVGGENSIVDYSYLFDAILFVCTEFEPDCDLRRRERLTEDIDFDVREQTFYADGSWMPTDSLVFDVGVQYQYNSYTDEEFVHPRVGSRWNVSDDIAFTLKAGRYNRFPDLETVLEETGNPDLKSPTADHYSLGYEHAMDNGWSVKVEGYYKELDMLPRALSEGEPNAELRYVNETDGRARGVDLMINKDRVGGKWWGWATLSYSKSNRTNLGTNETKEYFLDTPLIFNWVTNYQFTRRFNLGWRWSIRSGKAYTPIVGVQEHPWFEDSVLPIYGDSYSERLPYYSRLDIRFKWDMTTFGYDSALIIDVINALDSDNVSDRNLDYDKVKSPDDEVATEDSQEIGIQGAITYRVRF